MLYTMVNTHTRHANEQTLTHVAVGMGDHLVRMGSEGSLEHRTSGCCCCIVERRRLAALGRTGLAGRRRVGIRWVEAEDRPFEAASCAARTGQADLESGRCLVRCVGLLGVGVLLQLCADSLPPSSSPSILCGFL